MTRSKQVWTSGTLGFAKRALSSVTSGTAASSTKSYFMRFALQKRFPPPHQQYHWPRESFPTETEAVKKQGSSFFLWWTLNVARHLTTTSDDTWPHPDYTRCQNEVRPDDTLTTHTMSERSQARRHPDDTRCQNEVRRKSDDVRPSLRAGSPFNTNLGDCTSSHSFLSTHAHVFRRCTRKGTLLSFPPLSFFHSNPAECYKPTADTPPP